MSKDQRTDDVRPKGRRRRKMELASHVEEPDRFGTNELMRYCELNVHTVWGDLHCSPVNMSFCTDLLWQGTTMAIVPMVVGFVPVQR